MGAHRLVDTAIQGGDRVLALFPDFDLYGLRRVLRLALFQAFDGSSGEYEYLLEIDAEYTDVRGFVTLQFGGVKGVTLPQMMPSFYFAELEIDDVSRDQLEGIRFRAKDHGMTEFEVLCKTVAIRWHAELE